MMASGRYRWFSVYPLVMWRGPRACPGNISPTRFEWPPTARCRRWASSSPREIRIQRLDADVGIIHHTPYHSSKAFGSPPGRIRTSRFARPAAESRSSAPPAHHRQRDRVAQQKLRDSSCSTSCWSACPRWPTDSLQSILPVASAVVWRHGAIQLRRDAPVATSAKCVIEDNALPARSGHDESLNFLLRDTISLTMMAGRSRRT